MSLPDDFASVSADGHAIEPDDLFVERVDPSYRTRAPRIAYDPQADTLEVAGTSRPVGRMGIDVPADWPWATDPVARAAVLDEQGIAAEVLYPQWCLTLMNMEDKDLLCEVLRVYNAWLAEFCAAAPGRFIGMGVLPVHDVTASLEELIRVQALGLGGVTLPSERKDVRFNSRTYDPLWTAIETSGLPLSLHIGVNVIHTGRGAVPANLTAGLSPFRRIFPLFVFSGILERHPALRLVFAEGGISWLPGTLQDMDLLHDRYGDQLDVELSLSPSDFWRRSCLATFQEDPVGLEQAHHIGADTIMWAADLPHREGTFPHSRTRIRELAAAHLTTAEASAVFGDSARRLWGIAA